MATFIKNTLAENFIRSHGLADSENQFSLNDIPDLSGKVGVVTGGSEGQVLGVYCSRDTLSTRADFVKILLTHATALAMVAHILYCLRVLASFSSFLFHRR
jgi:hypothetical protein